MSDVSRPIIWLSWHFFYITKILSTSLLNSLRGSTVLKELKLGWLLHLYWYNENICILPNWTRRYRASFIIFCKLYIGPKLGWGILQWNLHERIISGERAINTVGFLLLLPESKRFFNQRAPRQLTKSILTYKKRNVTVFWMFVCLSFFFCFTWSSHELPAVSPSVYI